MHQLEIHPFHKIRRRWREIDSMAGVGLDPDPRKIPDEVWDQVGGRDNISDGMYLFCKSIIDATASMAVDYKVNTSFFSDSHGRVALEKIMNYLRVSQPDVVRVIDGKFADVSNTAQIIADYVFDVLDADGVLLNPYMGLDSVIPFSSRPDKFVVLCIHTSNPSANDVQGVRLSDGRRLWKYILEKAMAEWNEHENIIPVLSATHLDELRGIRQLIGNTPILLAGVGAQGGDLSQSVPLLIDKDGYGLMISSSRAILYAQRSAGESYAQAAHRELLKLKDDISSAKRSEI